MPLCQKIVKFLSAFEEKEHPIAQANAPVDEKENMSIRLVTSRVAGEFMMVKPEDIELMDISPNQLVSVSASLIPFLENDDANRALMGSNMQRQAVPLIVNQAPLVGTGIEGVVAKRFRGCDGCTSRWYCGGCGCFPDCSEDMNSDDDTMSKMM